MAQPGDMSPSAFHQLRAARLALIPMMYIRQSSDHNSIDWKDCALHQLHPSSYMGKGKCIALPQDGDTIPKPPALARDIMLCNLRVDNWELKRRRMAMSIGDTLSYHRTQHRVAP